MLSGPGMLSVVFAVFFFAFTIGYLVRANRDSIFHFFSGPNLGPNSGFFTLAVVLILVAGALFLIFQGRA